MSRSVTFNGITQFRAGGITRINANALAQIGLASFGIIGLVGEADGGTAAPGEIITIDDPALAGDYFKSGALADAIAPAFDPSVDPRIPGGAFRVLGIRTNAALQAALTLYGRQQTGTVDAGATTTVIPIVGAAFTVDALALNVLRIGSEDRVIASNTATDITVSTAFSAIPAATTAIEILAPMITVTSKPYGIEGNQTTFEWEPGITQGGAWTNAKGDRSQASEDVGDKSHLQVEYVGQASSIVQASGVATGGAASQLDDSLATWGVNAFTSYFVTVTLAGVVNLRKIASNTATQLTVTSAFTTSPTTEAYQVLSGMVRTGTAAAGAASTITLEAALNVAANELDGLVVAIVSGTGVGQRRTIASHTVGVSSVLTVSNAWTTTPDATSVYEIRYATAATGSFIGAAGVATYFRTSVAVDGGVAAQDLNIQLASTDTLEDLAATINANANYVATIPGGVNRQTTMASSFDFDLGNTDVDLLDDRNTVTAQPNPTYSYTVPWPNNFKRNIAQLVADLNDKSQYVTAVRATSGGTGTGGGRPEWTGTGTIGTIGDSIKYLTGGARGISDNTAFQSALDKLLQIRHNFAIPLIVQDLANEGFGSTATWASVAAQLSAHVDTANGIAKNECGGLIGFKGTKTQLIAEGNKLNNADIQITSQQLQVLNVSGSLALMDEWSLAVVAAGMRSGAPEVAEPITHKFIKTFDLQQDNSWDPRDRTDANQLIANGILFAEFVQGKGYRFVRDLTTYVQDDNLAYSEGSVRDAVRYIAYGLRTTLEDKFTGVKGTPANASSIKDTVVAYLDAANAENIIVTSLNEDGQVVPGYERLRVTVSGDIATIKVQIYPAVGINFQLNDIYLQLPRQAA